LRLFEEPEETVVRQLRAIDPDALDGAAALRHLRAWRRVLGLDADGADPA
jgi:hypothetical protein